MYLAHSTKKCWFLRWEAHAQPLRHPCSPSVSCGNGSYIDKAELRKTLYIECMKHNQKLKMNLSAGSTI